MLSCFCYFILFSFFKNVCVCVCALAVSRVYPWAKQVLWHWLKHSRSIKPYTLLSKSVQHNSTPLLAAGHTHQHWMCTLPTPNKIPCSVCVCVRESVYMCVWLHGYIQSVDPWADPTHTLTLTQSPWYMYCMSANHTKTVLLKALNRHYIWGSCFTRKVKDTYYSAQSGNVIHVSNCRILL